MAKKEKNSIFSLKDRVVIVTGAAGLLGKNHVEAIASFEGTPILLDINKEGIKELSNKINKEYDVESEYYHLDITDEKTVSECSKSIIEKFKKIDGLVLNAANNPKIEENKDKNFSRLEDFSLKSWNEDIGVGLTGSFLCSKYFGKVISKNPNGGSIVIISSDLGLIAPDQRLYLKEGVKENLQSVKPISYSVVKSGVIGLTRYLSTYWIESRVRCNAICPGGVENNQSEDFLKNISMRIPLGRMATEKEYQGVLIWMLSDASSYLNGAIVPVDGGRSAW